MKKLLLVGAILLTVGILLISAALLQGVQETEQRIQASEERSAEGITALRLEGDDAKTVILSHDRPDILIETDTPRERRFEVTQEGGVLQIKRLDERKWYQYFGIYMGLNDYDLRISLPAELAASLHLTQSAGDLDLHDLTLRGELTAKCSSGRLRAANLSVQALTLSVTSGVLHVNTVTALEDIDLQATSGAIFATALCTPGALTAQSSSGALMASDIRQASSVSLRVTSGGIRMENIQATAEILAHATSCGIRANRLLADCITLSGSSGGFTLSEITAADELRLQLSSGSIRAQNLQAAYASLQTVSGAQRIEASQIGTLTAESASGSIRLERCSIDQAATLKASSGSIRCGLSNRREEFTVFSNTISGSNRIPSGGNGEKRLEISATSGSISASFADE